MVCVVTPRRWRSPSMIYQCHDGKSRLILLFLHDRHGSLPWQRVVASRDGQPHLQIDLPFGPFTNHHTKVMKRLKNWCCLPLLVREHPQHRIWNLRVAGTKRRHHTGDTHTHTLLLFLSFPRVTTTLTRQKFNPRFIPAVHVSHTRCDISAFFIGRPRTQATLANIQCAHYFDETSLCL